LNSFYALISAILIFAAAAVLTMPAAARADSCNQSGNGYVPGQCNKTDSTEQGLETGLNNSDFTRGEENSRTRTEQEPATLRKQGIGKKAEAQERQLHMGESRHESSEQPGRAE
jgi:hypothetical protein